MPPSAAELIAHLNLRPLPREGGYYRETYRAPESLAANALPSRYGREKAPSTAIFYLLTTDTFSALHRLCTDEMFHFYLGSPIDMLLLSPDGAGQVVTLGPDILAGQSLQMLVRRETWQGSMLRAGGEFALLGTTMAPGFDFEDYEAGERETLVRQYPEYSDWIRRLTRLE